MKHLTITLKDKNQDLHSFKYKLTNHAELRMNQRGIDKDMLMYIILHATPICKQGLNYYYLTKKALPENTPAPLVKKLNNQVIVCDEDRGTILTVYHGYKGLIHLKKKRKMLSRWAA